MGNVQQYVENNIWLKDRKRKKKVISLDQNPNKTLYLTLRLIIWNNLVENNIQTKDMLKIIYTITRKKYMNENQTDILIFRTVS